MNGNELVLKNTHFVLIHKEKMPCLCLSPFIALAQQYCSGLKMENYSAELWYSIMPAMTWWIRWLCMSFVWRLFSGMMMKKNAAEPGDCCLAGILLHPHWIHECSYVCPHCCDPFAGWITMFSAFYRLLTDLKPFDQDCQNFLHAALPLVFRLKNKIMRWVL